MTINRYIVEGLLQDVQKGRRVVVVLDGPLTDELGMLFDHCDRLARDEPDLLVGISARRAHGQEALEHKSTGGRATFCTLGSLDRLHAWRGVDVLVAPGLSPHEHSADERERALWHHAMPAMATSQHRELIR